MLCLQLGIQHKEHFPCTGSNLLGSLEGIGLKVQRPNRSFFLIHSEARWGPEREYWQWKMERTGWVLEIICGVECDETARQPNVLHEDKIWRKGSQRFPAWVKMGNTKGRGSSLMERLWVQSWTWFWDIYMEVSGSDWKRVLVIGRGPELELW